MKDSTENILMILDHSVAESWVRVLMNLWILHLYVQLTLIRSSAFSVAFRCFGVHCSKIWKGLLLAAYEYIFSFFPLSSRIELVHRCNRVFVSKSHLLRITISLILEVYTLYGLNGVVNVDKSLDVDDSKIHIFAFRFQFYESLNTFQNSNDAIVF